MKAAIYVRVSTDHQAEKGYSIDTQLAACRKYASVLGATNIEEFVDDGYSAEFIDRPELTRLRESLKTKKFDKVIFNNKFMEIRNIAIIGFCLGGFLGFLSLRRRRFFISSELFPGEG